MKTPKRRFLSLIFACLNNNNNNNNSNDNNNNNNNVLRGYSRDVRKALKELVGDKSDTIALQIQKSVITSSLNIARRFAFKIMDIRRFIILLFFLFFLSVFIVRNRPFSI